MSHCCISKESIHCCNKHRCNHLLFCTSGQVMIQPYTYNYNNVSDSDYPCATPSPFDIIQNCAFIGMRYYTVHTLTFEPFRLTFNRMTFMNTAKVSK